MDKRIHYLIGLDTETCNGLLIDDKLDLSQSLVYDIGWAVTDKRGNIYKVRSFVVREIFCGMADVMKTAYYADKIPKYWEDIKAGRRSLSNFSRIRKFLLDDIKHYGIENIFAHNASFDVQALNNTIRYLTKSRFRWFFPYKIVVWDTLKMARQTIAKQKGYQLYCAEHGYLTKHKKPRVRLTAEILYRYLSGDRDFSESHTGLEDVLIETEIMAHCFRQHKKMEKRLYPI
jgi:hypothetical protein